MALDAELSVLEGEPKQYKSSIFSTLEPAFVKDKHALAVIAAHQGIKHLESLVGEPGERAEADTLDCLAWSYQQFLRGSSRIAIGLKKAGVESGLTILTAMPNAAEFHLFYLASFLAKLSFAPIDFGTLLKPRQDQLRYFLTLLKPSVVVIADTAGAEAVHDTEQALGVRIPVKITLDWDEKGPLTSDWRTLVSFSNFDDLVDTETLLHDARQDNFDRTAFTAFTSGTSSGRPKGCPRSVLSLMHNCNTVQRSWTEKPARRLIDTANFRVIMLTLSISTWFEGGALVMSGQAANPANVLMVIEKYQITDVLFIPAFLRIMNILPDFSPSKLTSVRTIATGGDVVTRSALQLCREMFPNSQAYPGFGMSEGGNFVGWDFTEPMRYFGEIASVGTVRPGIILKVVDHDGNPVPRGESGDLHVDTKTTIQHYLDDVSPDTFYSNDDGRWMRTGDIARVDADGYIYVVGRSKDIIKRAGVPITPAALESCLQPYAGAEASVFGIPHPILGAVPVAVLTTVGDKTEQDLKDHILEVFGKDYALGGAVTLKQLGFEAMPLNQTGKIQRLDLINRLNERPELLAACQN